MLESHNNEVNGTFLGAAVRLPRGYRLVAVSEPVKPLDGSLWPTLDAARHAAARAFLAAAQPPAALTPAALAPAARG